MPLAYFITHFPWLYPLLLLTRETEWSIKKQHLPPDQKPSNEKYSFRKFHIEYETGMNAKRKINDSYNWIHNKCGLIKINLTTGKLNSLLFADINDESLEILITFFFLVVQYTAVIIDITIDFVLLFFFTLYNE